MSDFKELQGIYFIIRDSINGEIRIGNSKTRGFGQIEFELSDLRYSVFHGKEEEFKADSGKGNGCARCYANRFNPG